jgi:hypothetical protein
LIVLRTITRLGERSAVPGREAATHDHGHLFPVSDPKTERYPAISVGFRTPDDWWRSAAESPIVGSKPVAQSASDPDSRSGWDSDSWYVRVLSATESSTSVVPKFESASSTSAPEIWR